MDDPAAKPAELSTLYPPGEYLEGAVEKKHKSAAGNIATGTPEFAALSSAFWAKCFELIEITVSKSSNGVAFIAAVKGFFIFANWFKLGCCEQ